MPASSWLVRLFAKRRPHPPFGHLPPQAGEGFFVMGDVGGEECRAERCKHPISRRGALYALFGYMGASSANGRATRQANEQLAPMGGSYAVIANDRYRSSGSTLL
jgi:hypothetical protein